MNGQNKKAQVKGFIKGVIFSLLIISVIFTISAAQMTKEATLHYNNIKITVDGKEVIPTDANGNLVEPFIIDGTTYLPVRAIANSLGLNVEWDASTNTAKLSTPAVEDESGLTEVEKWVEENGDELAAAMNAQYGESAICTVRAEGNTIIIDMKMLGIDNTPEDQKQMMQSAFDSMIPEFEQAFAGVESELPTLEKITFNVQEEDGDSLASFTIEF